MEKPKFEVQYYENAVPALRRFKTVKCNIQGNMNAALVEKISMCGV